jgi:hypothetical protein
MALSRARALRHGGGYLRPIRQGGMISGSGSSAQGRSAPLGVGIDVVGYAVFLDPPVDELQAARRISSGATASRWATNLLPVGPDLASSVRQHFVVTAGAVRVDREEGSGHGACYGFAAAAVAGLKDGACRPAFACRVPQLETAQV